MHIYSRPGYEPNSARLPVLYLLHGGGDTDDSWSTVGRAGAILDNLLAAGKAVTMIIVAPAGHISTDFHLTPGFRMGHHAFNDDLVKVVLPYVDATIARLWTAIIEPSTVSPWVGPNPHHRSH